MRWDTLVPQFASVAEEIVVAEAAALVLVPTVDTARTEYLVDVLARRGSPVMLVGHHGSAKSLVVQRYLSKTSSEDGRLSKTIVFSTATTSAALQVSSSVVSK